MRLADPTGPAPVADLSKVADLSGLRSVLRTLTARAGLSVRDIAQRTGVAPSTVNDHLNLRHLPQAGSWPSFAKVLVEVGVADQELPAWRDLLNQLRGSGGPAVVPYRGLASYAVQDAPWFFGREAAVTELVLRVAASRRAGWALIVLGSSGVGKSSVLQAGLVASLKSQPQIEGEAIEGPVVVTTPGTAGAGLVDLLERWPAGRGLLVLDQFEELLAGRRPDVDQLLVVRRLVDLAAGGAGVVLGLRADFYHAVLELPGLLPAAQNNLYVLAPMTEAQLRQAIEEPARKAGLRVSPALVDLLLADLQDASQAPGALPLLSHALTQACERRAAGSRSVDAALYRQAGGLRGALAQTAEACWQGLTPAQQDAAHELLLRLVVAGEETADTRRRLPRAELEGIDEDSAAALDALVRHRLVTADQSTVELAHEVLLRAWPRLRDWLEADRENLLLRRQLTEAARLWEAGDRDASGLLVGSRLAALRVALEDGAHRRRLGARERALIEASVRAEQAAAAAQARRHRHRAQLATVLAVLLLVSAGLAGYSAWLAEHLSAERQAAQSRQLATEADRMRSVDAAAAAQAATSALQLGGTEQARSAVLDSWAGPVPGQLTMAAGGTRVGVTFDAAHLVAVGRDGSVQVWRRPGDGSLPVASGALQLPGAPDLFALALSPHADVAYVGGDTQAVQLVRIGEDGAPVAAGAVLAGLGERVLGLAVSPDGRWLAAVGYDGHVWLTGLDGDGQPTGVTHRWLEPSAAGGPTRAQAVVFSGDGAHLVVGDADGAIRVYRVERPGVPVARAQTPKGSVMSLAVSSSGTRLAVGTGASMLQLYRMAADGSLAPDGEPVLGPVGWYLGVAFSPDGALVAASTNGGATSIWDVQDRTLLQQDPGSGEIGGLVFTPEGSSLLTVSLAGVLRVWPGHPAQLGGLRGQVAQVGWTPDGVQVVAGGVNDQVARYDTGPGASHLPTAVYSAPPRSVSTPVNWQKLNGVFALDPLGGVLAVAGRDGVVRLMDARGPGGSEPLAGLTIGQDPVLSLSWSRSGTLLAAGDAGGHLQVWDVRDPTHPARRASVQLGDRVGAVDLSPDGGLLAATDSDGRVHAFAVDGAGRLAAHSVLPAPQTGQLSALVFSPHGHRLATAGDDGRLRLYQRAGSTLIPQGPPVDAAADVLTGVSWSPDGRQLALSSADGTVRVWAVDGAVPQRRLVLRATGAPATSVAFSPDGGRLAAGSRTGRVVIWSTSPTEAATAICARIGDRMRPQDWDRYALGIQAPRPCPGSGAGS